MSDIPVNYCSHCGVEVTTLKAKFCKGCGAALAGNGPAQVIVPQEPAGVMKVKEFQHQSSYAGWLRANQGKVKIVSVTTTKRWGLALGLLGRAKTYTVTYEVSAETDRQERNTQLGGHLFFVLVFGGLIMIWAYLVHP